ncbi:MAG: hypothetical protein J0L57_08000 [Burkholderiales bacterium]|nr:hypothetical protein [Burkholderiales bacterium]
MPPASREGAPAANPSPRGDAWQVPAPQPLHRELPAHEQAVIDAALAILGRRLREPGAVFDAPQAVREYLRLWLGRGDCECFAVAFLDGRHAVIAAEVLFVGTLTQTSVYPREVARRALQLNAGAVILAHNHPSGNAEPSRADEFLTQTLRTALGLFDVRVLDHLVVGWPDVTSLAECGLLEPDPPSWPRRHRAAGRRGRESGAACEGMR